METKPEPKGVFKRETRTVVDAQRSIRDDSEIDESTKEQIVRFMSYLAVDNLKLKTVVSYAVSLRKLAKLCPGKGFPHLQRSDVQQMILALQEEGYEQCKMQGEIWDLDMWPLGIKSVEAKKARLESEMLRFEKDKADEVTAAWKDAFSVKSDFLEAIRELRKVQSQRSIFAESPAPMPINTGYGEDLIY